MFTCMLKIAINFLFEQAKSLFYILTSLHKGQTNNVIENIFVTKISDDGNTLLKVVV